METTKKGWRAISNEATPKVESFIGNRNGKKSISMYDAFLLVVLLAALINTNIYSHWLLIMLIFWERPHIIIRDFAENAERFRRNKAFENRLIKEAKAKLKNK